MGRRKKQEVRILLKGTKVLVPSVFRERKFLKDSVFLVNLRLRIPVAEIEKFSSSQWIKNFTEAFICIWKQVVSQASWLKYGQSEQWGRKKSVRKSVCKTPRSFIPYPSGQHIPPLQSHTLRGGTALPYLFGKREKVSGRHGGESKALLQQCSSITLW